MKYVRYNDLTNTYLTKNKVYEVFTFNISKKFIYFMIVDDLNRVSNFTIWFNKSNLFEEVTQEYIRGETITKILE